MPLILSPPPGRKLAQSARCCHRTQIQFLVGIFGCNSQGTLTESSWQAHPMLGDLFDFFDWRVQAQKPTPSQADFLGGEDLQRKIFSNFLPKEIINFPKKQLRRNFFFVNFGLKRVKFLRGPKKKTMRSGPGGCPTNVGKREGLQLKEFEASRPGAFWKGFSAHLQAHLPPPAKYQSAQ